MKKPRTLPKPRKAGADDLSAIRGIGPKIKDQLNEFGIYHYDQIAGWKKSECNWVNDHLKYKGRIEREEWVKQAKALAKPAKKPHSKTRAVKSATPAKTEKNITGYGSGGVDTVISVEAVTREVAKMSDGVPDAAALTKMANDNPFLSIEKLKAGYGQMEILHDFDLFVEKGQSLCLIGPNGAGKSTVLHSIFGFTTIFSGRISVEGKEITHQKPNDKLKTAGIAYILQDNSVFPNMTVEENLWMGGFLKDRPDEAKEAAERVFQKYDRLAKRRSQPARVLSGGERRLLEISRALVMNPEILLVDEPSIGLEPRFIDMVFEILDDLQNAEGKTIVMVEQNAKKGLEFADIGYVLVSGELAKAGSGKELLDDPDVGRLFLGG
ncbi:MAG: ATP-binding cassette domain-containing protein [Hyphomicrobiales bacterium]|nr:ATP-binding cassette domain-containing protein [Hyphomicrobiales bacterium]